MSNIGMTVGLIKALAPKPDPEDVKQSVEDWLEDHPEATTTVQDGSITKAKLDSSLKGTVDDVDALKSAIENEVNYSNIYTTLYNNAFYVNGDYIGPSFITNNSTRISNINASGTSFVNDGIIEITVRTKIVIADGYSIACVRAKYDASTITYRVDPTTPFAWSTGTILVEPSAEYNNLIFMLKENSNADISISDVPNILSITTTNGVKEKIEQLEAYAELSPITLPFTLTGINTKVYKLQIGEYKAISTLPKIKKENGAVAFISPSGLHDNDGLTINTPVKTIAEALAVPNVETIIFLEGTYTANTHFYTGELINKSVNMIGIGNVIIDNIQGQNNNPLNFIQSCYVKNIHFMHGNNTVKVTLSNGMTAVFEDCIFSDSDNAEFSNGLAIRGGSAYVVNCKAYNNSYDGFNYHANDSAINYAIEIGCESYNNGSAQLDSDSGQSSNATTSHDGSYIVRVNGDYYACHGGIVADLSAHSANYGCKAGISTVTNGTNYADRMSNYWASATDMYLYDCESYGSKYDTARLNGGTITSNVAYASNYSAQ